MYPSTTILRQTQSALRTSALRRPITAARPASVSSLGLGIAGKRWNTQEQRGGKSKLIFRFGLRDIPVELYPMAFVVAAACVGAGIAVGRQSLFHSPTVYRGDLRTGPTKKQE
ncbi:hypothetical protein CI109_102147 [Kwoniella shandongensis]|uniref:Uncharacterized protein n=1 Tax=Kwoniella shandongensis TaxID=1734106 RepID=A0A5M6C4C9_9TREE|nr:uncharacterized protein CI109_003694 [Kwoniella shandongensis]KAA5528039.1 hypothetical protein CI109_003694 [Kwoniella shandongensis]